MSDKLQGFIDGMEHSATLLVNDMQRQFGTPILQCVEPNGGCGREETGDWSYLRSGWPKCHGYAMRLITGNEPNEKRER